MSNLDRRQFVAGAAAAATAPAVSVPAKASAPSSPQSEEPTCFLSYSYAAFEPDGGIDCWSRLVCDIRHSRYLPRQVASGSIFHESGAAAARQNAQRLADEAAAEAGTWPVGEPDARRRFAFPVEAGRLAWELKSLVEDRPVGSRTAFIALDSLGPHDEPSWADLLPAFRSSYDRIIGHFHLERRGLRQWKAWLDASFPQERGKSYFQTFFLDAAAQCDAVVLTSPALVEYDIGFNYRRASTEELVGEQIRRLGYALLDRTVLNRIVSVGEKDAARKPRLFALGSDAFHSPRGLQPTARLMHFHYSLGCQQSLVQGAFGEPVWSEPPLVVVTYDDHDSDADILSGWANACKLAGPTYELPGPRPDRRRPDSPPNVLELIALWRFEMDG